MTSLLRVANRWFTEVNGDLWEKPARVGWWTAYILIFAATASLVIRRISGSFQHPPTTAVLVSVGLVATIWCTLLRRLERRCGIESIGPRGNWESFLFLFGLLSPACLLLLLSVTFQDAPVLGLIATWSGLVAAETNWWTMLHVRQSASGHVFPGTAGITPRLAARRLGAPITDEASDGSLPSEVTQQMTRTRVENGIETIYGSLRADFVAGERLRAVHVTFCPPLAAVPEFCVEQADGPAAIVEVAQLAPFGARLEAKLEKPATEDKSIVLQFEAVCNRAATIAT